MQILCTGCNFAKDILTMEEARVLLAKIKIAWHARSSEEREAGEQGLLFSY